MRWFMSNRLAWSTSECQARFRKSSPGLLLNFSALRKCKALSKLSMSHTSHQSEVRASQASSFNLNNNLELGMNYIHILEVRKKCDLCLCRMSTGTLH